MTTTPEPTVLVTRFCREDMKSDHKNFPWPMEGPVSCSDWDPTPFCGKGLHGWLYGKGNVCVWEHRSSDKMLVVEVLAKDIVDLKGKVKFPKGTVVHCGTRDSVTQYMKERGHEGILMGKCVVGDGETAEVKGTYSEGLAGDHGVAKSDHYAVAGHYGFAEAWGTKVGDYGTAIAKGAWGRAEVGVGGKAAGDSDTVLYFKDSAGAYHSCYVSALGGFKPNTFYKLSPLDPPTVEET